MKDVSNPVQTMTYKNWRGEISQRRVIIKSFRFGVSQWHEKPCWLMRAFDLEKEADREFELVSCDFLSPRVDV